MVKITTIIMAFVILGSLVLGGWISLQRMQEDNTYIQCCGGSACSDTYYTYEDNLCHLVMCERMKAIQFTKDNCTYPGANISLNAI
jgi:hypothetical protein